MKTVLITGGAGFIGSHTVDKFLNKGFKVKIIDNLSGGREENISHHKRNKNHQKRKKKAKILPLIQLFLKS